MFVISTVRLIKRRWIAHEEVFAATVAFSGLAMASSLFVLAPAADYRYMIWMILSALLSAAVLAISILRESLPDELKPHNGVY